MNFHEVRFPAALSVGSSGGPERRTEIVTLKNGFEERNAPWAHSRRRYDAGLGVRSLDDLGEVIAFFEARHGQLHGFRWKDWTDFKSGAPSAAPRATDQALGTGDGSRQGLRPRQGLSFGGAVLRAADPQAGRGKRGRGGVGCGAGDRGLQRRHGAGAGVPGLGAGRGRSGDGRVRVRRAGALRQRPDHGQPRGVRGGGIPRSPWSRCGSDARDRSRAAGAAGRRRHAALPLLAGEPAGRRRDGLHRSRRGFGLRRGGLSGEQRDGRHGAAVGDRTERRQRAGGGGPDERRDQRGGHPRRQVRRRGDPPVAGRTGSGRTSGC